MIRALGVDLQAALRSRGVPFPVVDGPEQGAPISYARERIVVENFGNDSFEAPLSQHRNPKAVALRVVGAKLTIYAKSPRAGALPFEHRERAERVLDHVLVCLDALGRRSQLRFLSGQWITPEDFNETERPNGAAYELTFTIGRAVYDATWTNEARPEVTLGPGLIVNRTRVSRAHGPDDNGDPTTPVPSAETGCGA